MSIVYLNGNYVQQQDATISIMDRGLLFGDGVYEVIPVYDGKPFLLAKHLKRLGQSLEGIYLKGTTQLLEELPHILQRLITVNGAGDLQLYVQITRGNYHTRKHDLPSEVSPTIFAFCMHNPFPNHATASQGITAITLDDIRWKLCYIKAITLLPNILLNHEAQLRGAQEAILIRDGYAIEGMASNLFIVKDNVIITPPLNMEILEGITRNFIVTLAEKHHIKVEQRAITVRELKSADEIWLTNSTREIRPVLTLDKQVISDKPGPCWEKLYALFQDFKQHELE